jgi:HK97 family phage portal protein
MISKIKSFFSNETKSKPLSIVDLLGYHSCDQYGWYEIRAHQAWRYVNSVAPLGRGIRIISNEFASIVPVVRDIETEEIVTTPNKSTQLFLDLLERPNFDKTRREFMYSLCSSYLATGEIYIMCTGITRPQELYYFNPAYVHVNPGPGGVPKSITYNDSFQAIKFMPKEDGASFQFVSPDSSKKVYQIADFNPKYSNEQRGLSRLCPIYYEIEQYIRTSIHNISTLRKGARPSGILTIDSNMTLEQRSNTRKQINAFYGGEGNVGNVMVVDGGKEFKQLSLTNKDMDFANLKLQTKQACYEALEIPASFYDNSASSFNNKDIDRVNIYDFAVLPIANRIFEELTYIMHQQQPDTQGVALSYNLIDIPALQSRFNEQIKKKADMGIFMINELRDESGDESIGPEGDVLYQPRSLTPVGTEASNTSFTAQKRFREILKKRGFTDLQIKAYEESYKENAGR